MPRQDPSDSGYKNNYGTTNCPRCGRLVSRNALGFHSHLRACIKRDILFEGKVYKAILNRIEI